MSIMIYVLSAVAAVDPGPHPMSQPEIQARFIDWNSGDFFPTDPGIKEFLLTCGPKLFPKIKSEDPWEYSDALIELDFTDEEIISGCLE